MMHTKVTNGHRPTNGFGLPLRSNPDHGTSRAMLLYQDAESRKWAEEVYAKLGTSNGKKPLVSTWWNVNDLCHPGVLAGAVSTALRAELFIVAICSSGGMPLPFYVWSDLWLPNRTANGGALVALIGHTDEVDFQLGHTREYLRQLADRAGLRFLAQERRLKRHMLVANGKSGPHSALRERSTFAAAI